jgi:hypothetical protein
MKAAISLAVALLAASGGAAAVGNLETPAEGQVATGIGIVSGWHCTAKSVTFRVDSSDPAPAATGTERRDTASVCAGAINTGFSLLLNYNLITPGAHTIVAFADGVEFARANFTTTNLGVEFLFNESGRRYLRNFPDMNQTVIVDWQENRQNFSITGRGNGTASPVSPVAGTYYGAAGTQCASDPQPTMQDERFARFDISVSSDNQTMTMQVRYADSFVCSLSGAMTAGNDGFFVVATPTSTCQLGTTNLRIEADGIRVKGVLGAVGGTGCFTTRAFYGVKPYRLE